MSDAIKAVDTSPKLLPLRQSDIDEIERYCRFLPGELSGLKCSGFEPHVSAGRQRRAVLHEADDVPGGVRPREGGYQFQEDGHNVRHEQGLPLLEDSDFDFFDLWDRMRSKMEPAGAMRRITNVRRHMESTVDGAVQWGVLCLYYAPVAHEQDGRRVARTPIAEAFGELAPIARFTVSARAAAERLFLKDRKAWLERQHSLKLRGLSPCRPGETVAQTMAWLESNLPLEPTPVQRDRFTTLAIEAAVKKTNSPLVTDICVEALDMWKEAGDAFRRAKTALGQDTHRGKTKTSRWTSTDQFRPKPISKAKAS